MVRVELSNFVSALKKILPLLPLSDKVEDWEKSLSYRQVLDSVTKQTSQMVSLDQLLDAVLHSSVCCKCSSSEKEPPILKQPVVLADPESQMKFDDKSIKLKWNEESSDDDNCEIDDNPQQRRQSTLPEPKNRFETSPVNQSLPVY